MGACLGSDRARAYGRIGNCEMSAGLSFRGAQAAGDEESGFRSRHYQVQIPRPRDGLGMTLNEETQSVARERTP